MDRRHFLGACAGLAVGRGLRLSSHPEALGAGEGLGLQLYTVRNLLAADFRGTLEQVARIGYGEVEFAGYHGRPPGEAGKVASELGLDPVSAHVPLSRILEAPESLLDDAPAAGHRHVVLAWIEAERRQSLDDWLRLAEIMAEFAERCAGRGLTFAYHNHAYDFEPLEGRAPYDLLVEATPARLVRLQLDLFWLQAGGRDPLEEVRRHGERVLSCHVKDMDARGRMVDVGAGVMSFGPILAAAREGGVRHFFVEHDEPGEPLESARRGYRHLRSLEA